MGRFRTHRWFLPVAGLGLLGGCAIPLDLLNTGLASNLGFDAFSISPPEGRVIIAFNNQTGLEAGFFVAYSESASDPTLNVKTIFADFVAPDEVRNRVIDCPTGVVTPGDPGGNGDIAAFVNDGDQGVEIAYAGEPLVPGRDFNCGDVIEIRLVQIGTGTDEANFALQIRVYPGR
ncbi:MAG: hypothetical protein IT450_13515 [Phycisphaerales bacterium]|nr:hypothetical protein [Phycisphaerales bacterium]